MYSLYVYTCIVCMYIHVWFVCIYMYIKEIATKAFKPLPRHHHKSAFVRKCYNNE